MGVLLLVDGQLVKRLFGQSFSVLFTRISALGTGATAEVVVAKSHLFFEVGVGIAAFECTVLKLLAYCCFFDGRVVAALSTGVVLVLHGSPLFGTKALFQRETQRCGGADGLKA